MILVKKLSCDGGVFFFCFDRLSMTILVFLIFLVLLVFFGFLVFLILLVFYFKGLNTDLMD